MQTSTNPRDSNIHAEKPSTGNEQEDLRIQELQTQMKNQQDLINKLITQIKAPGANNPAYGGVPPPNNPAYGSVPPPPPPNKPSDPKMGIMEVNIIHLICILDQVFDLMVRLLVMLA